MGTKRKKTKKKHCWLDYLDLKKFLSTAKLMIIYQLGMKLVTYSACC